MGWRHILSNQALRYSDTEVVKSSYTFFLRNHHLQPLWSHRWSCDHCIKYEKEKLIWSFLPQSHQRNRTLSGGNTPLGPLCSCWVWPTLLKACKTALHALSPPILDKQCFIVHSNFLPHCCWDHSSCSLSGLGWKLCACEEWCSVIHIGALWFLQVLPQFSDHLHLQASQQSLAQSQCPFLPSPIGGAQGYEHQFHLPATSRVFPPGNLPHGHLQSLFCWQTEQFLLKCCAYKDARTLSTVSLSLQCCSTHASTCFTGPGGHFKGAHWGTCLAIPITFQTSKGALVGTDTSYFNASLKLSSISRAGFHCTTQPYGPYSQATSHCRDSIET